MTDTMRLALPMLDPGQAQKEWFHNEGLALLDIAVQSVVEGTRDMPPLDPADGACWIVGATPGDAWAGRAGAIAGWTQGGWRFVLPRNGFAVWDAGLGTLIRRREGAWTADRSAPIAVPTGGAMVDTEARASLAAILAVLTQRGWLG